MIINFHWLDMIPHSVYPLQLQMFGTSLKWAQKVKIMLVWIPPKPPSFFGAPKNLVLVATGALCTD